MRWKNQQVHVRVGSGQRLATQNAGEGGTRPESLTQHTLLGTVADDDPVRVQTAGTQVSIDHREKSDVLFNRKTTDEAQGERYRAGAVASLRREQGGIHATLHEIAGTPCPGVQQVTQLWVGSIEDLSEPVKTGRDGQGSGFGSQTQRASEAAQAFCPGSDATPCILVHIGVPACREGDTETPGEIGTEDAELTGAGDVEDIGPEVFERLADRVGMTKEERIKGEILLHANRPGASLELQRLDTALLDELVCRATGADAEHGQAAALGKRNEVTRGVGDPVDLAEAVRKERDTWHERVYRSGTRFRTSSVSQGATVAGTMPLSEILPGSWRSSFELAAHNCTHSPSSSSQGDEPGFSTEDPRF